MKLYDHKTLGSILLIAGTQIGAGMLALPITTAKAGIVYSLGLFLISFFYMLLTLFLLLEANLYEESYEANIISMSKKRLGTIGQFVAWFSFLLLLYAVAAAYISAGGSLFGQVLNKVSGFVDSHLGITLFIVIFGGIVFFGAWLIDYVNRLLMLGLMVSYVALIIFVIPHINVQNFTLGDPRFLLSAVPVVVLSFTSHIIVPSLRTYLNNNVSKLKKALLIGSLVPLIFYIVWEILILTVLPVHGDYGLATIASGPHPVATMTETLDKHLGLKWIALTVGAFSFFALVTSFLGVMLALMDFLADGFQIKRDLRGRSLLLLITLIPPIVFAILYPSGFVLALSYAGVFVAILYGILPVIMIWKARYKEKLSAVYRVKGGKPVLILSVVLSTLVIILQVASTLDLLPK